MTELKETRICECDCHKDEQVIMHFMGCCEVCEAKYITVDGYVDIDRWAVAFKHIHKHTPTTLQKDGKWFWIHK